MFRALTGIFVAEAVDMLNTIDTAVLETVTGGAAPGPSPKKQAELRQMAQRYCPQTYARFKGAPQITRPMGEKCLDEAGLGMFKGRLDQYFPRK